MSAGIINALNAPTARAKTARRESGQEMERERERSEGVAGGANFTDRRPWRMWTSSLAPTRYTWSLRWAHDVMACFIYGREKLPVGRLRFSISPPLDFWKACSWYNQGDFVRDPRSFFFQELLFFLLDGWASRGTRAGYGIQSSGSWLVFADVLSSPRARERCNVTRGGYCSTRSLDEVSHLSEEFLIILQYSTLHLEI